MDVRLQRRELAGIPDDIEFATKPEQAAVMLRAAHSRGVAAGFVTGDEVYGSRDLRRSIRELGMGYVMAVRHDHTVALAGISTTARKTVRLIPDEGWQRLKTGAGTKGIRSYDWAILAIDPDDTTDQHATGHNALLVRRHRYTRKLSFYRCWSPRPVPLSTLVKVATFRWKLEEDHQLAKHTSGLARRHLQPLEDMVETASAISEGDLSRRVDTSPAGGSEVEQLREALNAMLQQIEDAMASREHAAARHRQFLADASHELRTPLATVQGYLQLYEKGILDDAEAERALARVGAEADRMGRLVDELLALARLEQQPASVRAPVDLAVLVRDAAADLGAQQPGRPVDVDAPEPVVVIGDDARLRQVLGNLLANVRTHTPEDAACTLSARAEDGAAVLRIADTGPGMRPEDAARIFDGFFRADPDRARVPGGSGLGMSIVQAVVESHDGEIELDTAPDAGMKVTIRLPLRGETPRNITATSAHGGAR
ncbi:ATP-binding protein [Streptomyces sp. WAC 06738]|uniref:ATP-binding protein n=1 Tax=Streptomyces sp. WAC 06738 TaxID=2203210 RepID=UPI001F0B724E|nr:ATP-binding protein [Streptomyces sp. WAC 06738]